MMSKLLFNCRRNWTRVTCAVILRGGFGAFTLVYHLQGAEILALCWIAGEASLEIESILPANMFCEVDCKGVSLHPIEYEQENLQQSMNRRIFNKV